jgi:hypothetical protein
MSSRDTLRANALSLSFLLHRRRASTSSSFFDGRTSATAGNKAGELVHGEQSASASSVVVVDAGMCGMRENGLDQRFVDRRASADVGAAKRVVVQRGIELVIEIVQESGDTPRLDVLAGARGVPAHGALDGQGVLEQTVALRVLGQ